MTRAAVALLWTLALLAGMNGKASAETWPTRPIRAILPFAAGTATDVVARLVFHQLSNQLGQQIVIENRGGGGGLIGTTAVAKADPDGYTILTQSTSHTIIPALHAELPYDVMRDFAAVASFGRMPTALLVSPDKGIRTVQELVAAAKAKPGTFTYASAGVGSTTHLTAERFRLSAGLDVIHVPFKGGGFRPEVMSGRIDFAFSPIAAALADIRSGRLNALAVSGRSRVAALPDVPTTLEAGYANSDYELWIGVFAPAKTPRPIVDRLHDEIVKALRTPELHEKLKTFDIEPMNLSPAEFDSFIRDDIVAQAALAKAAGLKAN